MHGVKTKEGNYLEKNEIRISRVPGKLREGTCKGWGWPGLKLPIRYDIGNETQGPHTYSKSLRA